jgi:cytochrome c oxidase subunit 4
LALGGFDLDLSVPALLLGDLGENMAHVHNNQLEQQSRHHIVPFESYIKVFGALIVLTVVTVAVSRIDLGVWNTVVAMLIATIKASLVLAIFMHLKYDDRLNRVIFGTGIFFLTVLLVTCFTDIFTRFNQTPH